MEEIVGPLFPLTFLGLLVAEQAAGRKQFPRVRFWVLKGVVFFVLSALLNTVLPPALASALAPARLFDLTGLGVLGGVAVVFLGTTFVDYWTHRVFHRSDLAWRYAHQLHHSAERVDMAGFTYSHPTELLVSIGTSALVGTLLGASPDAVVVAGYLYFVTGLLQHFDVRTPRWLGWFVQRPEQHRLHHARGIHAYNFGLPLWDVLFGTWRNPADWQGEYGFYPGASGHLGELLIGRDVSGMALGRSDEPSAQR